jgi:hypothetical protein
VLEVQRLDVQGMGVLDGGQVGHHPAEGHVSIAIRGTVVVDGHVARAALLQAHLGAQQAQEGVHVVPLAQEQGQLLLLEGRQEALGELLPLHGRDADGGVLLGAAAQAWQQQVAPVAGQGRADAGGHRQPVGGGDAGDAGEVHGLVLAGPGDVQQQELGDPLGVRPIVGHHRAIQGHGGGAAARQGQTGQGRSQVSRRGHQ